MTRNRVCKSIEIRGELDSPIGTGPSSLTILTRRGYKGAKHGASVVSFRYIKNDSRLALSSVG